MKIPRISLELRTALIYLIFGVIWILTTDRILEIFVTNTHLITNLQSIKGWIFVLFSAFLIYTIIKRFLTKEKFLDQQMKANEERFYQLFSESLDAILLSAPDGSIYAANPAACNVFGRSEEEICSVGRRGLIDSTDPRLPGALEERTRTGHFFGELTFIRKDGTKFTGEISTRLFQTPDGKIRSSMIIRDVTERKKAEDALIVREEELLRLNLELENRVADRTRELEGALIKAQEADKIKSSFLATMSHELRTPLNSIIGFSGILAQEMAGPLNGEQSKQVGIIRQSAKHLLNLINDVLDLSKIEAGQMEIHKSAFDLRKAVSEVVLRTQPQAQSKGLKLQTVVDPAIDTLYSDQRRLEQILMNLVANAIKFTNKGEVIVECGQKGGEVFIRVRDTGIGIRDEDKLVLFAPFQQVDHALNRQFEGTGLGLPISQNLAMLLGGSIEVESEWGKGSTFSLRLPAH